jgi:predicted RNA-binding Zn-ribbon protein involved in translation (DUF1610 family)
LWNLFKLRKGDFTLEGKKFVLLRKLLIAIGITEEAANDIIDWIEDLLSGKGGKKEFTDLPYKMRDDFLSPAERNFYFVIKNSVAEWADVCPKVNLGDIFYATCANFGERQSYANKINRKHIDFLLCDRKTATPLLGVELDDRSHNQEKRQERDSFVEKVFEKALLPLERIPVQLAYNPGEINSRLLKAAGLRKMHSTDIIPKQITVEANSGNPVCPKCGGEMILRISKTGSKIGQKFWGCPNFPRCRSVLPYA